jgi:hypothetical protein
MFRINKPDWTEFVKLFLDPFSRPFPDSAALNAFDDALAALAQAPVEFRAGIEQAGSACRVEFFSPSLPKITPPGPLLAKNCPARYGNTLIFL